MKTKGGKWVPKCISKSTIIYLQLGIRELREMLDPKNRKDKRAKMAKAFNVAKIEFLKAWNVISRKMTPETYL